MCGVCVCSSVHALLVGPTAVHLEEHEWELGGELMTPSFKLKRAPLLKRYQQEIDRMYATVKAQQASKK